MCNLYSITKGQQAIREFTRAMSDRTGNLPPLPGTLWVGDGGAPPSYLYDVLATGQFKVCGSGDGVAVDSNGTPIATATCP